MYFQLKKQNGSCSGFVIMPDHVPAMVWFSEPNQLSTFRKQWKQQSSVKKNLIRNCFQNYESKSDITEPIWQRKYYSFNLFLSSKLIEKLNHMHASPVNAGLVEYPEDWKYSSARFFSQGKSVGLPIEPPDWASCC